MSNYLLRDIPPELWRAVKHKAVDAGTSMRAVVFAALAAYCATPPPLTKGARGDLKKMPRP